ncbi:uncharacterized protein LOC128896095 [Hylaeus anthracinus]|uniref:uncharacterized protein LOC128896095 n=1 Tax=Hylaeus anthracinus TaxID=313031 RepID=UPI0023B8BB36|nr:uncharacterized protein LOC128896095 [Hylaeus anthracinus]
MCWLTCMYNSECSKFKTRKSRDLKRKRFNVNELLLKLKVMPQEMNILCCYSCKMYQVHIVKKAKKWQCKICNVKQILKRVYFQGSGKDCRIQVQKLNAMKEYEIETSTSFVFDMDMQSGSNHKSQVALNKWKKYLDTSEEIDCNTFEMTNDESDSDKENDGPKYLNNDNVTYEHSNSFCKTNSKKYVSYNKEKVYDHAIEEELIDNKSSNGVTQHNNITNDKAINNIFDDNEDFDLAIGF